MMTPWRLFLDDEHTGARNMAVDEAMLLEHARGLALPTLRFYGWNPHCLSLGRLQKQLPDAARQKERLANSQNENPNPTPTLLDGALSRASEGEKTAHFDIVRRPTGGRAVWHAREITYCAIVRAGLLPPEARGVEGAYRWLSQGFLRGLQSLGVPAAMAPGGVRTAGPNCFAASAGCDFLAGGKKLIGAAQCRAEGTILQHGSLLLSIDAARWEEIAGGPMECAIGLSELGEFSREKVISALAQGFGEVAGAGWQTGKLSAREEDLAQCLQRRKYARAEWTFGARIAEQDRAEIAATLQL